MTLNIKSRQHLLIFFIILLCTPKVSLSYFVNGLQIRDLEGVYPNTDFETEAVAWQATATASSPIWTKCNNVYLLGGYGILGTSGGSSYLRYFWRTFSSLPSHTMVRYSFLMYFIDSWDSNGIDGFKFSFDDKVYDGWHLPYTANSDTTSLCGSSARDTPNARIFGMALHAGTSMTFKLISYLDEDPFNESFGIREISFSFYQGPTMSETQCIILPSTVTNTDRKCQCPLGSYHDTATNSCQPCDSTCISCFGAGPENCYKCKQGGYGYDGLKCIACHPYCQECFGTAANQCKACATSYSFYAAGTTCLYDCPFPLTKAGSGPYTCTSTCSTATDFVYWDQTCLSTCTAPLVQSTIYSSIKTCTYPCSPDEYLYWDGSCLSACQTPLQITVTKGRNFCTYKCTSSQYLDWTNTCVSSCSSPFVVKTIQGKNLCKGPCSAPGEYYYWNNECSTACDSPLDKRTTNGIDYCDYKCTGTNYLYWDATCQSSCNPPLKIRTERGKLFCDFPADPANYLYWDGTQSSTCPTPPYTSTSSGSKKFCNYPCQLYEYLYWDGSCSVECLPPLTQRKAHGRLFCDYPCTGSNIPYWNGSCLASSPCATPLEQRTVATKVVCDFPAGNASNFLYWDKSFSVTCPPPLIQRLEGTNPVRKFCDYKCLPAEYLSFDGTCVGTCSPTATRTQSGKKFCDFTCGTQYSYYNNTCNTICPSPFKKRVAGLGNYCDHPCATVTDYYYWDGTCNSKCDSPLQSFSLSGINWCIYPCSANQFLAKDSLCLDSCDFPLQVNIQSGLKYCVNPCTSGQYLFWNGTCIPSCPSPLRYESSENGNLCFLPCNTPEEYYTEETGQCVKECLASTSGPGGLYLICLTSKSDNSTFLDIILEAPTKPAYSLISLPNLMEYIRYIDFQSPPRFKRFTAGKGQSILTLRFGPRMSDEMREDFPNMDIPDVFKRANLHSNFIVNFYEEITSWVIFVFILVGLSLCEAICGKKDWEAARNFFEKLLIIVKWNYLLVLISTSIQKVIVYVSVQFGTLNMDSSFSSVSLELCLVMISFPLMVMVGSYWLVLKHLAVQKEGPAFKISEFMVAWQGYQVLFRGFRDNNLFNANFYLLYLLRMVVVGLIASQLYFTPMFQTSVYMVISLLVLGYIIKMKPLIRKINYIQLVIFEFIVLFVNASLFGIGILHRIGKENTSLAVMLGDIAIAGVSLTNLLFIVILAVKVLLGIKMIFYSACNKLHLNNWLPLVVYYVQQAGMGFEEIALNPKTETQVRSDMGFAHSNIRPSISKESAKIRVSRILPEEDKSRLLAARTRILNTETNISMNKESPSKFLKPETGTLGLGDSTPPSSSNTKLATDGKTRTSKFTFSNIE